MNADRSAERGGDPRSARAHSGKIARLFLSRSSRDSREAVALRAWLRNDQLDPDDPGKHWFSRFRFYGRWSRTSIAAGNSAISSRRLPVRSELACAIAEPAQENPTADSRGPRRIA
jgi:hypothetical protein